MSYFIRSFYLFFLFWMQDTPLPSSTIDLNMPYCQTDEMLAQQLENPIKKQAFLDFEKQLHETILTPNSNFVTADYTLPIVVHIIHENGEENISDSQVLQAINDLNNGFSHSSPYYAGLGIDTKIEFCLATQTPDGIATNGINRIASPLTDMNSLLDDDDLKNLIRWNPNDYINIWVVKEICKGVDNCNIAGYAYLPNAHGNDEDGIVVEAAFMGSSSVNSVVLIHEMGHYLGLYHTFEGGCNNDDCLLDGDRVCDTPPDQSTLAINCGASENSCSTDTNAGFSTDKDDFSWNFMDYGDINCQTGFTVGQTARMIFSIENPRASLLNSSGCLPPCLVDISVNISANNPNIGVNETVTFTKNSSDANQFVWFENGIMVSNQDAWTTSFAEAGTYQIIIQASNDNWSCQAADTLFVHVTCAAEASFSADQVSIMLEDVVYFSNTSNNATSFEWYMDDILVSTEENFQFTFHVEGFYEIILVASNNTCSTHSVAQFIVVNNPCVSANVGKITIPEIYEIINFTKTNDGGYVVLAVDYNLDDLVIKLDGHKQIQWSKHITLPYYYWYDVLQDKSDNGLIIMGYSNQTLAASKYPVVFKMDLDGNLLWGFHLPTDLYFSRDVVQMKDGHFLLTGVFGGSLDMKTFALKFDSAGNVLWYKSFHKFRLSHTHIAPDGSIIMAASLELGFTFLPSVNLMKLTPDGEICWRKFYDFNNSGNVFNGFDPRPIIFNEQGDMTFVFERHAGQNVSTITDFYAGSIDSNGDVLWSKRLPPSGRIANFNRLDNDHYGLWTSTGVLYELSPENGEILHRIKYNNINPLPKTLKIFEDESIGFCGLNDIVFLDKELNIGLCGKDTINNIIAEDVPFETGSYTAATYDLTGVTHFTLPVIDIPVTIQRICDVPIPQFPDAIPHLQKAFLCGDSLHVLLEICNKGTIDLPADLPLSFYQNNPTWATTNLVYTTESGFLIPADTCFSIEKTMLYNNENQLFIVANDDGTLNPIYNFGSDFPLTDISECNFYNNLDSIELNAILPPVLTVSNDTIICPNTEINLSAMSDFFQYQWSNGQTDSTISISNFGVYQVTATDFCGNTQVDSIQVDWLPIPTLDLNNPLPTCESQVVILDAGDGFISYQWQDGFPESTYTTWEAGKYWVTTEDACGNVATDTVEILFGTPDLTMPLDTIIYEGDIAFLNTHIGTATQPIDYQWFPDIHLDCITCPNVIAMPDSTTLYFLQITDGYGCTTLDSVYVFVENRMDTTAISTEEKTFLHTPNVFSPNGDGTNDFFYLQSNQTVFLHSLEIFDRWGNLVFQSQNPILNNPADGWNGQVKGQSAASAVYVFRVVFQLENGEIKTEAGDLLLMR